MKIFSVKEAAQYIATKTGKPISITQVSHEAKLGYLSAQKIGHTYVITEEALQSYKRRKPGAKSKQKKSETTESNRPKTLHRI